MNEPASIVADRTAEWRDLILKLAILVLAGLWIYSPAYHGDWLWDDDQSITANPVTQGPWSFHKIWVAPHGADYFPLSAKIIEARKSGEFRHWNDLVDRVQGVGPASAAKLSQAGLTVSGTSYDGAPAAAKARNARDGAKPSDGKPADARAERSARADKTAGAEKTR